jgi:hypothetical protein
MRWTHDRRSGWLRPRPVCLLAASICLWTGAPAHAFELKLWPLIDYRSGEEGLRLGLLGPLLSFERTAASWRLTLRPLLQLGHGDDGETRLSLLYPMLVLRTSPQLTDIRFFAFVSYRATHAPNPDRDRSFTAFPLVFYEHTPDEGTSLSVLPIYADLEHRFGFDRLRMVLFPLFLRTEDDLVERTWLPFPFVSWTGGKLGRGWRFWPFYGWEEAGLAARFTYVLWPFYVSEERHFTRPERERRLLLYPFYGSIDAPALQSEQYFWPLFFPFLNHTVDHAAQTETWGFPWPAWLSQRDLATSERTTLRLAPFYAEAHSDNREGGFLLWPLYRWKEHTDDTHHYQRSDVLLFMYRNILAEQLEPRRSRQLQTFFPFYRASRRDTRTQWSSLALLDALFPRNESIADVYAPLWQIYTRQADADAPAQWSLLWDLVSSDGTRIRYPVHLDFEP